MLSHVQLSGCDIMHFYKTGGKQAFTGLLLAYLTHHGTGVTQWVPSSSSRSGISSQQALLQLSPHSPLWPPAPGSASGRFLSPLENPCEELCRIPGSAGEVSPSVCKRIWILAFSAWSGGAVDIFLWFLRNPLAAQQPLPKKWFVGPRCWAASFADGCSKGTAKETGKKTVGVQKFKLERKGLKRSN